MNAEKGGRKRPVLQKAGRASKTHCSCASRLATFPRWLMAASKTAEAGVRLTALGCHRGSNSPTTKRCLHLQDGQTEAQEVDELSCALLGRKHLQLEGEQTSLPPPDPEFLTTIYNHCTTREARNGVFADLQNVSTRLPSQLSPPQLSPKSPFSFAPFGESQRAPAATVKQAGGQIGAGDTGRGQNLGSWGPSWGNAAGDLQAGPSQVG